MHLGVGYAGSQPGWEQPVSLKHGSHCQMKNEFILSIQTKKYKNKKQKKNTHTHNTNVAEKTDLAKLRERERERERERSYRIIVTSKRKKLLPLQ